MNEQRIKDLNVGLLGLAFMLTFSAFQTMGNVQTVILDSAKNSNATEEGGYVPGFTGDGFTSLAIIYAVFSIANWFAPPVVAFIGPRFTLISGGVCYALFIAQLTYPNNYMLYGASALVGLGAAMIWVAQGNFLTLNSGPETMERNSGIFWAMLQMSLIIGNTFFYFQLQDIEQIDRATRLTVALVLLGICIVGVITFVFLRPTPWASDTDTAAASTPIQTFISALQLLLTPNMLLLFITFAYTGLALTFWSGVYGTCIGFTEAFGEKRKSYVGLHGIFVGLGEILGGFAFGIMGKFVAKYGRHLPVSLGFLVSGGAYLIAYLNLPADAPIHETSNEAIIASNIYLALFGSFMLGLGDACYNTQIFSFLGSVYKDDSAAGFAIFKFAQSAFAAAAFFYSNEIDLTWQLLFLAILCVLGTSTFCFVELKVRSRERNPYLVGGDSPEQNTTAEVDNSCGIVANEPEAPEAIRKD